MDPPGSSVHGIFPSKNTGVDCRFLLQGIFPTQELNPGLLNVHGFGWTLGVDDRQGGLACCSFHGVAESDTTERLN